MTTSKIDSHADRSSFAIGDFVIGLSGLLWSGKENVYEMMPVFRVSGVVLFSDEESFFLFTEQGIESFTDHHHYPSFWKRIYLREGNS